MGSKLWNDILEIHLGLHDEIRIIYGVDHYEAQLYTRDGNQHACSGIGDTIEKSLSNLAFKIMFGFQIQFKLP